MPSATTIIDLARLSLAHGEGRRLELPVELEPLELGGQTYAPTRRSPTVRLDVSRPSGGFAFRLALPGPPRGPVHALPRAGRARARGRGPRGRPARHRRRGAAQPLRRRATSSTSAAGPTTPPSSPSRPASSAAPTAPASARPAASPSTTPTPPTTSTTAGTDPRWAALKGPEARVSSSASASTGADLDVGSATAAARRARRPAPRRGRRGGRGRAARRRGTSAG